MDERVGLRVDLEAGRPRACLLVGVLLGLVYAALAQTVQWAGTFSAAAASVASFWPAAGVTVVALLLLPRAAWPWALGGVLVAEVALDLYHGVGLVSALGWGLANTVEPLCSALLLRRGGRRLPDLAQRADLLLFVRCAVLAGPLLAGTIAATTGALLAGSAADLPVDLLRWSVGDAVGVLAVAPALLALRPSARTGGPFPLLPVALFGLLVVLTVALAPVVGRRVAPVDSVVCLLIPALAWLALRGGQRASATGVLLVAAVVEVTTAAGTGPFGAAGGFDGLVDSQLFLAACALTASLVSVATHDLVRRDELAERLRTQASTDALTGLGNRRRVVERSAELQEQGRTFSACLVVDLDRFKQVNDSLGHAAGDEVLVEVAGRLREAVREDDLVARTGGDEFLVCLSRVCSETDLAALSDRIAARLAEPLTVAGLPLALGASVGAAWAVGPVPTEELVRRADQVMYARKQAGRGRVVAEPLGS